MILSRCQFVVILNWTYIRTFFQLPNLEIFKFEIIAVFWSHIFLSVVFNLTTLNWLYIMLILIQLMKMQFNKILKECYYFSNSDWFFEQKFAFNLLCLINKMVHFSSLTNSVKWYTLIHYFTNKHLLDFTWGKVALLYNYLHIFKKNNFLIHYEIFLMQNM